MLQQEEVYGGHELAEMYEEGDYSWYKVYTDGSGINGTQREIARAGWGVYYAKAQQRILRSNSMDQCKRHIEQN